MFFIIIKKCNGAARDQFGILVLTIEHLSQVVMYRYHGVSKCLCSPKIHNLNYNWPVYRGIGGRKQTNRNHCK